MPLGDGRAVVSEKTKKTLVLIYLTVFSAVFLALVLRNPFYNWDMIGYVASAVRFEVADPSEVQRRVYGELKASVPADVYGRLTGGHERQLRATDPESFRQHLPFYQIRVLYGAAIYATAKCGVNPFFASHLVSAVCACLAVWVVAFLFRPAEHPEYQVFVPFVCLMFGLSSLARYSTPDAMGLLVVSACYLLLLRRNALLLVLLPLSILVRTDLVILAFLFYVYLFAQKRFDRRALAASALATLALYVGVNRLYGNPGWETVFYYTLVERLAYPLTDPHAVGVATYVSVLKKGLVDGLRDGMPLTYLLAVGLASLLAWKDRGPIRRHLGQSFPDVLFLLASGALYVAGHFVLFPAAWPRFFAAEYILATCLLVYLISSTAEFLGLEPTRH